MNKNKFNLRNVVAVAICLVGLMAFVGCESKTDLADNPLVGKWITAGNGDVLDGRVIVFTSNLRVEQYFDYLYRGHHSIPLDYPSSFYVTYSISGNEITFTVHRFYPTVHTFDATHRFVLNDNLLMIEAFSNPFSGTFEGRFNIHFTRVQ